MRLRRRYRVLIDPKVQLGLCLRVTMYWAVCLLSVAAMLTWGIAFDGQGLSASQCLDQLWQRYGAVLLVTFLVLPLPLLDCLIFSNKFAGPVWRLRKELRRLADGHDVQPIHFRQGDLLLGLDLEFNRIVAQVQAQRNGQAATGCENEIQAEPDTVSSYT